MRAPQQHQDAKIEAPTLSCIDHLLECHEQILILAGKQNDVPGEGFVPCRYEDY
jgi:hypothetical protein